MARYKIMAFDGGGVRGALSASLLNELTKMESLAGFTARADLLAGTSTGGLIALMLAAGFSPDAILDLYIDKVPQVFERPFARRLPGIRHVFDAFWPKYDNRNLLHLAEEVFTPDLKLGDLQQNVLITSFDLDGVLDGRRSWKPKFFHNFEIEGNDSGQRVVDVAMRTAAAPAYFPVYQTYVDGGVVVNNPSIPALLQALYEPDDPGESQRSDVPTMSEIALLNVGTGSFEKWVPGRDQRWGYLRWAPLFPDISISTQTGMGEFEGRTLLGPRFLRLNPELRTFIPMDAVGEVGYLAGLPVSDPNVREMLNDARRWLLKYFV